MNIKSACYIVYSWMIKKNSLQGLSRNYLKRFKENSFVEGKCTEYGQYEASITKLYHSIEKGLTYEKEQYKVGFGKRNIENLLAAMDAYSKKYDVTAFFYETALSVLEQYVEKNKKYGLVDNELE